MLHQRYPATSLEGLLRPVEALPYPAIDDRAAWEAVPDALARAARQAGEALDGTDYPPLPATLFLEFSREGNRERYETLSFARRATLEALVLAECVANRGRYLDAIADGIWAICEESFWGVPAHMYLQKAGSTLPDPNEPVVDLFCAETANMLSWVHRLLGKRLDAVSPMLRTRIEREVNRRMLAPMMERDDFWWMGFHLPPGRERVNNWNPWIASNWLSCILLLERQPEARAAAIAKLMRMVDHFVDTYPSDGGCDEGPAYWGHAGASLFDVLELLHWASSGEIDLFSQPLIRNIGQYIYRAHIADDYYINFADAPALIQPDPALVGAFGVAINDAEMIEFGRWLDARHGLSHFAGEVPGKKRQVSFLRRPLRQLFGSLSGVAAAASATGTVIERVKAPDSNAIPPLPREVFLDQIEVLVARDRHGSPDGWFMSAKGGHNAESHNHNDVGGFVIYRDGRPLIVDAGVETYTAKTFSQSRYEIWTMQSAYHALLPQVSGVQQAAGRSFAASDVTATIEEESASLELEIAGAYPEEAGIRSWNRRITLERGSGVIVKDRYELDREGHAIIFSVLTPAEVVPADGAIRFLPREFLPDRRSAEGVLEFDASLLEPTLEVIQITDTRMGGTWGGSLNRVVLHAGSVPGTGSFTFRIRSASPL